MEEFMLDLYYLKNELVLRVDFSWRYLLLLW